MGLDLGEKTIGVAVSDEMGWTAQPVTVVRRSSKARDIQALKVVIEEYGVESIVLGLPLNMDGSEGPMAQKARRFGRFLEEQLGLAVEFEDERLSTASAEWVLLEADVSRAKRKKVIDKVAAAVILQDWLDGRSDGGAL